EELGRQPEVWSALIRAVNWRFTLVGCVCALVEWADRFYADLAYRFQTGSWVSPQVAVTLGLLHPRSAVQLLSDFLEPPLAHQHPKALAAAQVVLGHLDIADDTEAV